MPPPDFCPLCPTRPGAAPGDIERADFEIAVFENRFPALRRDPPEPAVQGSALTPVRPAKSESRRIPAHVARTAWKRDGNRCAFMGTAGRCAETRYLELHHIQPYGHQGPATVENISVRCRAHNIYECELVFGAWAPETGGKTREKHAVWRENAPS